MTTITASEARTYLRCREEHRLAYRELWRPATPAPALRLGTLIHSALERWWMREPWGDWLVTYAQDLGLDDYEVVRAQEMMRVYDLTWAEAREEYLVDGIEVEFSATIGGGHELRGKVDGLARIGRPTRRVVIEHKTTSEDVAPGSPYWQGLQMDIQLQAYLIATGAESVIWDAVRKPAIEPLRATPSDKRKRRKDGALYARQREADETPAEYRDRLRAAMSEGVWVHRQELTLLEPELERARRELAQIAGEIERQPGDDPAIRTTSACRRYGRLCDYYAHCSGQWSLEEIGLVRVDRPHQELT